MKLNEPKRQNSWFLIRGPQDSRLHRYRAGVCGGIRGTYLAEFT